jgi:hypothetical protein
VLGKGRLLDRRDLARIAVAAALAVCVSVAGCSSGPPATNGYKAGTKLGMTQAQAEAILGKPKQQAAFVLGALKAYVLTYQFGQLLLENGKVVAISIADAPTYVGPFGIKLGMPEDGVKAAFAAHKEKRTGHKDGYDDVVGTTDTRTRDLYDETDQLMIEMAAANPNDPLAPFNVISITQANGAGLALLTAITKAKIGGMYPDQHVFNYISEPWKT